MIDKLDVIIKCMVLLYRESLLSELTEAKLQDSSVDIVRTILQTFKSDRKQLIGGDTAILIDLETLLTDMVNNVEKFTNKELLLQTLSVILRDKDNIYKLIDKYINTEMEVGGLKNSIVSLRKFLNIYYKEVQATTLISKASYMLNSNRLEGSFQDFLGSFIANLEALNTKVVTKDPGIVNELDVSDTDNLEHVVEVAKEMSNSTGRFITGWKQMNKMLGGGFRRGTMWCVSALQHNYKSGMIQSLFVQFCTLNKPVMTDPNKKPLIVLFSFEDDLNVIIEFMYRYMYYNEHEEIPDINAISKKDMAHYVTTKLSVNGFHAKILRVSPSEWTYKNIFNKILEYESQGYEVQACIIDYLSKLPTTYCDNTGPQGSALRDLFTRTRDFFSARNCLVISPHQVSTDALNLYRSGVKGFEFLDEISNKNYYSDSRQIPQVLDGEIYICKGKEADKWFLYVGKGKDRSPIIVADEDKQFRLQFPKHAPIKENLGDPDDYTDGADSGKDEFDF